MSTFVEYATESLSPPRLRGVWGTRWVTAFAAEYDWLDERLTQSVLARFPRFCPADGLVLIGQDRQIVRAPMESDASYSKRLWSAWETWRWSGTGPGVMAGIHSSGVPSPPWGLGPDWTDDWSSMGYVWLVPFRCMKQPPPNTPANAALFYVVIDYYAMTGGDVGYRRGEPGFIRGPWGARGTKFTQGEFQALVASIRKWKGAGETCAEIILCVTPNGVGDVRLPIWRRGRGTRRGNGMGIRIPIGERGYRG